MRNGRAKSTSACYQGNVNSALIMGDVGHGARSDALPTERGRERGKGLQGTGEATKSTGAQEQEKTQAVRS